MNLPAKTAKQDTPCAKARSAMKNKGMSSEERQKMIADWLATWLKEGDSRLAMH